MRRGREWSAFALLAIFGVVLGYGMLEFGVRTLHLLPDRFWQPDAQLGWRHIAGKSGWWTQEDHEFRVAIQINPQGLRDVDHAYAKPAGTMRVLLLGDSFIEALQVPMESMVGRRLQATLGAGSEVISTGVSGYGTASELEFLRREGSRYDPDLVLLAFYPGNDVKNNSPTLEDALRPVYDAEGKLLRVNPSGGDGTPSLSSKGWRDHLRAYQFFRQLLLRHPEMAAPLHRIGLLKAEGTRFAPERDGVPVDYWVFAAEPDAEWREAWQHTEHLLAEMREVVTAGGRRFAIVVVPSRYQIYPEIWDETVAAHPAMRGRQWDLDKPAQRVLQWCAAHDVSCLDLAKGFQRAKGNTPLYFHFDGHWTPAGHEVAAQLIAAFVRAPLASVH